MFCAASLCQDNSSESSPIMRDKVGDHMARDLRPFLYTVSLQILQIPGEKERPTHTLPGGVTVHVTNYPAKKQCGCTPVLTTGLTFYKMNV